MLRGASAPFLKVTRTRILLRGRWRARSSRAHSCTLAVTQNERVIPLVHTTQVNNGHLLTLEKQKHKLTKKRVFNFTQVFKYFTKKVLILLLFTVKMAY